MSALQWRTRYGFYAYQQAISEGIATSCPIQESPLLVWYGKTVDQGVFAKIATPPYPLVLHFNLHPMPRSKSPPQRAGSHTPRHTEPLTNVWLGAY